MSSIEDYRPLADRVRPQTAAVFYGQQHLMAEGKPLRAAIDKGNLHSFILWGPPGTGKTTIAKLVAHTCDAEFIALSAVLCGVKDIRVAIDRAQQHRQVNGKDTILFVDEAHRFNKAQQDGFLPFIEDGTIIFIGATTENPAFELNNALLSRVRVYKLNTLSTDNITTILQQAIDNENGYAGRVSIEEEALTKIAQAADGDARTALNLLEVATDQAIDNKINVATIDSILASSSIRRFDHGGDIFYDQISALHKSIRGSSPDAALYWFARMIDGGCDPLYIARRVVRIASEDIGNADPRGLRIALDAWEAQERLGTPEGTLSIGQAIIYLACAPKSNAVYRAYQAAFNDVQEGGNDEVPLHLRNAPARLLKNMGHGKDYRYAHDEPEGYAAGENYFPERLGKRCYYMPVERGLEIKILEKLQRLNDLDMQYKTL